MRPVKIAIALTGLVTPWSAFAQSSDSEPPEAPIGAYSDVPVGAFDMIAPPVNGPRLGEGDGDWTMRYGGFLRAGYNGSIGHRVDANGNESHPFHIPASVPDNIFNTWTLTNSQPTSWGSFSLSIGTNTISTGVYFGAWAHSPSSQAPLQAQWAEGTMAFGPWVNFRSNDLFGSKIRGDITVGNGAQYYGQAGKYDLGPYGTTAVGGVQAFGEKLGLEKDFGDYTLRIEDGIGANPSDQNVAGTTVIHHAHAIVNYKDNVRVGLHYFGVGASNPNADNPTTTGSPEGTSVADPKVPDGSITAIGADLRLNNSMIGDLFIGGGHVDLKHVRNVGGAYTVANVGGGQSFMDNFLGTDIPAGSYNYGTGSLTNLMVQYDFSLTAVKRYPAIFWGDGPDIRLSVFGLGTYVRSAEARWDKILKVKWGADFVYTFMPWVGLALRYDRVAPDWDRQEQTFQVITPRIIFRTSYNSHEQIILQYSRYIYGSDPVGPQMPNMTVLHANGTGESGKPFAENVIGLAGQMWF